MEKYKYPPGCITSKPGRKATMAQLDLETAQRFIAASERLAAAMDRHTAAMDRHTAALKTRGSGPRPRPQARPDTTPRGGIPESARIRPDLVGSTTAREDPRSAAAPTWGHNDEESPWGQLHPRLTEPDMQFDGDGRVTQTRPAKRNKNPGLLERAVTRVLTPKEVE